MGLPARLLLGVAGLAAAFYHGVPDLLRLGIAAAQLLRAPRPA